MPANVYKVDIIQSKDVSTEEDIITNPADYVHQTFSRELYCPYGHNWSSGTLIPMSNGRPYCPKCGERLKKVRVRRK